MPERLGWSLGGPFDLDSGDGLVWTAVGASDLDDRARVPPPRCLLRNLRVELSAIDGAASVTTQLARQPDGTGAFSDRTLDAATQTICLAKTGATTSSEAGIVVWPLDTFIAVRASSDGLYIGLELDAGTATIDRIEVTWEIR